MIQQELKWITAQLPKSALKHAYVAGGAAIAPHTADDIDVCVIGDYYETLANHFAFHPQAVHTSENFQRIPEHKRENYALATGNLGSHPRIEVVANLFDPANGRKYQIIVAHAWSVQDLMNRFDLTVHQWAISLFTGEAFKGELATLPSQQPRVAEIHNAVHTLRRLKKLCDRYGWEWKTHPDLPKLRTHAVNAGKVREFQAELEADIDSISPEDVPF